LNISIFKINISISNDDKPISVVEQPEAILYRKADILFDLLIDFKKKHYQPKDKILNEAIDKFVKYKFESWFDVVSNIQNALLNKGYSFKQPTIFGRSNNNIIIADIQKIIYITNDIIKWVNQNQRLKPTC
jgi:hypothetical protein